MLSDKKNNKPKLGKTDYLKMEVPWKSTSSVHHKEGWVDFQLTGPGLYTILKPVSLYTRGLKQQWSGGATRKQDQRACS